MFARFTTYLTKGEHKALEALAETEYRALHEEVRFILCAELKRRGLIEDAQANNPPAQIIS